MNRKKVPFDFITSKPIESTDYFDEDAVESTSSKRERSQSSMPYEEARKKDILKAPVTRYYIGSHLSSP